MRNVKVAERTWTADDDNEDDDKVTSTKGDRTESEDPVSAGIFSYTYARV